MHIRELSVKQQLFIDFLIFFLIGIVAANFLGVESFQKNGSLTRYFLKQFQYTQIDSHELLWCVCCNRLCIFLMLAFLCIMTKEKPVHVLFVAWSGFAFGYFCVMSISGFGARGLLLCLIALFPQFLFYVPVYLGLVELSVRRREYMAWRGIVAGILLLLGLVVGILLESYINPIILQKILKFF